MARGYMEKIVRINLTNGDISYENPSEEDREKYLGGSGLATKYLWDEVPAGTDPLGPDNKLIVMSGPLTGTPSPSTGRYSVVAKSPATNLWAQANSAGFWGVDFKRSGFDGAIFEGASDKWVYVVLDNGVAEIRDGEHLKGMDCAETTDTIKEELGEKWEVACIGPAGENLVKYAAIMNDASPAGFGRAAGRCGLGSVMGSKKLKAIAARKQQKIEIANPKEYKEEAKMHFDWVNESILKMSLEELGTAMALDTIQVMGGLPTKNFQEGEFDDFEEIDGLAIIDKILVKRRACFACPVACGRVTKLPKYDDFEGEGPEYESLALMGSGCGINDLEDISMANHLCNQYGLDTISAGNVIGFAMECYEKGLLTKEDTGGIDLTWGNGEALVQLMPMIAKREGFGDFLAEGVKIMSEKIGQGSEDFAMHVKGLELSGYDPRGAKPCGLSFVTANRGGCHITAYVQGPTYMCMPFLVVDDSDVGDDALVEDPKGSKVVKEMEDMFAVFDSIGGCKFIGLVTTGEDWAKLVEFLTGWEFPVEKLRQTGERIYTLERAFNCREGLTRDDDILPKRATDEPIPAG
ncbi:MAG: aldehyde ferredoxin oxidoreductase family protein, partial [Actinobacteria bacterium]|nr:aldehyde ferredoxin oxidoreductase family protein [Actinomycetota bacterium]